MTESPFRIVVACDDASQAELLIAAAHEALPSGDVQRLERALAAATPEPSGVLARADLVIVGTGPLVAQAASLVGTLTRQRPRPALLVCGPPLGADELLHLMRAGADEYLPLPAPPADAADAVRRVASRSGRAPTPESASGRSVAVFSTTSGAGVTTLAVNLALALRAPGEPSVLLLDLAPGGGDADALLDVIPRYGVDDLLRNLHRMDASLLSSYVEHHSSGIDLLRAPTATDGAPLSAEQVTAVLRAVTPHYAWVVVDAGNVLSPATSELLARVDVPVHVVTPSVASLRSARRALGVLRQRMPGFRVRGLTVVNGLDPDVPISARDVASTLELEPACVLERDDAMRRRDAVGRGPALLHGRSRWVKELRSLARQLEAPAEVRDPVTTPEAAATGPRTAASPRRTRTAGRATEREPLALDAES